MPVLRYNPELQEKLGAKTKAEPWMHCFVGEGEYFIYIWDTRKLIEKGNSKNAWMHKLGKNVAYAKDNHKPIDGLSKSDIQYTEMYYWPAEQLALQHGIKLPTYDQMRDQWEHWRTRGSSFYGNNAFFVSYAKQLANWYLKDPKKNFNRLVCKLYCAMNTNSGSYVGYAQGKPVADPTFNDIAFSINDSATALAKQFVKANR
jgi:hypothetical protein